MANTPRKGGTHQKALREAYVKVVRDFFQKEYDPGDMSAWV